MIIKNCVVLNLNETPNSNGYCFAKDCKISFSERLTVNIGYPEVPDGSGECFNIRQEGQSIVADINIQKKSLIDLIKEGLEKHPQVFSYPCIKIETIKPIYDDEQYFKPIEECKLLEVNICNSNIDASITPFDPKEKKIKDLESLLSIKSDAPDL